MKPESQRRAEPAQSRRADTLLEAERQILEMVVRGRPLADVLDFLCRAAEAELELPVGAVVVHAGAPRSDVAPCSAPIASETGASLGVLAAHFPEGRAPSSEQRRVVEALARTAALAMDRDGADGGAGVAERASADRASIHDRARLEYAVRLSRVGFWYCDLPFDELVWDARVKEHFFLAPDAHVTIDTFYDRIHPADRPATREAIERSIRERASYDVVYRTVDPESGAVKWIRALGGTAYAPDGTPAHFDGVTVDVTAQRLDQERLARVLERERGQTRLLEQIAAAALNIHGSSSIEHVLQVVTEEARTIIGAHQAVASLTLDDDWARAVHGASLSDKYRSLQGHDARPPGAELYSLVCATNRPVRMTRAELAAHPAFGASSRAPNEPPHHGWLAVPFVGRDGKNLGLVQLSDKYEAEFTEADGAILTQLAQIAAVALENARLYDQLRDQDRKKDEFLATLAHELRNPLAPIRTGLEVLRVTANAEHAAKARQMMERQLGHLVRMVDDLLDISRITLGKVALKKEPIDLRSVLSSALETARPLIESLNHAIAVRLPDEPLAIDVDPTRIAQVIANLVNNAAKYTPPGGRIELTAERDDGVLSVRVRDTGVGIPREMLGHVFDMFTQVGVTMDRSQGGLGIGLTLARRLVELHGGSVEADSAGPGLGSTFTVRLPLASPRDDAGSVASGVRPAPGPTLRVLVVDDNVDGAESLAMLLELGGHSTRMAHTGPDALAAAAEFLPDVVFLDIGLPVLNGYEVAKRLRAEADRPRPYLIALTGWGTDEDRRQAHAAGFDHHLVKPVDTAKVSDLLAGLGSARAQPVS